MRCEHDDVFIAGTGKIRLSNIRHPCMEMQDEIAFISNDAELTKGLLIFCTVCAFVLK